MASPPPPYANITGISRTVMKDNAQESLGNYDGNARPGELVMNLLTDPPTVYIGNNLGQLTLLTLSGSGNGVPAGPVNSIQFNAGNNFFGGTANVVVSGTGISVVGNVQAGNVITNILSASGNVYGNYGVFSGGNTVINSVISTTGNIIAGNISAAGNIYANNIVGNTTFNGGYYGAFHSDSDTTLSTSINTNSTSPIVVDSTAGFRSSGYIIMETEIIQYTGISGNTFTGITRGVSGSTKANHAAGTPIAPGQVAAAGVPAIVLLDTTDLSSGITLNTATGEFTIVNAGTYNCQYSIQGANFGNDYDNLTVWFAVNGVNIPSSASIGTLVLAHGGTPGASIITVNIFYTFAAGDELTINWSTLRGTTAIASYPPAASPAIPSSPGIIFTINQIA